MCRNVGCNRHVYDHLSCMQEICLKYGCMWNTIMAIYPMYMKYHQSCNILVTIKDWYRIYYRSYTSIGTGKRTGNYALYCIRKHYGNSQLS